MTRNEALSKAMKLCSTKEYAPFEIEQKLADWGVASQTIHEIIEELKKEKFIDEFRMAVYFANDKLRFNKWGKIKIKYMLQQKKVSPETISNALNQIKQEEYEQILRSEITKKRKGIKDTDEFKVKAKLYQFATGRGFETDQIYRVIGDIS